MRRLSFVGGDDSVGNNGETLPPSTIAETMAKLLGQDIQIVEVRMKIAAIISSRKQLEDLGRLFAEIDVDKSGALDLGEFIAGMTAYDYTISPHDAEVIFHLVDADNSGELDLDEFKAMQKNSLELMTMAKHLEAADEGEGGSAEEEEAKVQEQARLAAALNQGVRLQRTNSSFDPKMQGDIAMMAPAQLELRRALKESPKVQQMVRGWWESCGLDAGGRMGKDLYMEISIALHRMVEPGVALAVMTDTAADDWKDDLELYGEKNGTATLHYDGFYEAMFQLCDTWVDTTDETDYTVFLQKMQGAHEELKQLTAGLDEDQRVAFMAATEGMSEARQEQLMSAMRELDKEAKAVMLDVLSDMSGEEKEKLLDVMADISAEGKVQLLEAMQAMGQETKAAMLGVMADMSGEQKQQLLDVMGDLTEADKGKLVEAMQGMDKKTQAAMLGVMADLSGEQKQQLLDVMGELGSEGKEAIMQAMKSMDEETKAAMLTVMSGLSDGGKVTAARVMGKMDAKQQKQFLGTMEKLAPESQSALATLMEGMLVSERIAFLRAAANMSEEEILAMMEAVAMKTFKQCSYTYCRCCTPGYVAPYAFKKSVGKFCQECTHYQVICGPLKANPIADLLSVVNADSKLLEVIGGEVIPPLDANQGGERYGGESAARRAEESSAHVIDNADGTRSTTVTKADGTKVITVTSVEGAVIQTNVEHAKGEDGTITTIVVGADGSSSTSVRTAENAVNGSGLESGGEEGGGGNGGHYFPPSQEAGGDIGLNKGMLDKPAQSAMKVAQRGREKVAEEDVVYGRLKILKRMGAIKGVLKSHSDPVIDCACLLRALITSNAPPGEPFEQSLSNVLAMLKSDDFNKAVEAREAKRRRRERRQKKRGGGDSGDGRDGRLEQGVRKEGARGASRVREDAPGYRKKYDDRHFERKVAEEGALAEETGVAGGTQAGEQRQREEGRAVDMVPREVTSFPKLAGRDQEVAKRYDGSRLLRNGQGTVPKRRAERTRNTVSSLYKHGQHQTSAPSLGKGKGKGRLVKTMNGNDACAREAAQYIRQGGQLDVAVVPSSRPKRTRTSASALYLPQVPGVSPSHGRGKPRLRSAA
jgi:hypothetical protein